MVKKIIKKYSNSESIRNISTLATGTTIAQIFVLFTTPITYRIYDKNDYGTLAQYMAIIGVLGVFSTLQFNQAILIEKEDKDAKNILFFNQSINLIVSTLICLLVFIFSNNLVDYLNNEAIRPWLYLIPISIFFKGQNDILKVWANRNKQYKILSLNSILIAAIVPIISISLGLLLSGEIFGLFIGFLAGQIIPPIIMGIRLAKDGNIFFKKLKLDTIKQIAKKHISLPKYSLPSEFLSMFSAQLPVFLISSFSGTATVGLYNLAVRILNLPIQVIGSSVENVFKEQASKAYNKYGHCEDVFKKTLKGLTLLSIIPFSFVLFFGDDIFALVFGETWRMAGNFARILIILYFFNFITGPLSYMYFIANKLKEDFLIRIPMIISMAAGLYFGLMISTTTGLLVFSIVRALFYIYILYRSYLFSKK